MYESSKQWMDDWVYTCLYIPNRWCKLYGQKAVLCCAGCKWLDLCNGLPCTREEKSPTQIIEVEVPTDNSNRCVNNNNRDNNNPVNTTIQPTSIPTDLAVESVQTRCLAEMSKEGRCLHRSYTLDLRTLSPDQVSPIDTALYNRMPLRTRYIHWIVIHIE